jgi:hypothetical protein
MDDKEGNNAEEEAHRIMDMEHHRRSMEISVAVSSARRVHPNIHGVELRLRGRFWAGNLTRKMALAVTKWIDCLSLCISCRYLHRQRHPTSSQKLTLIVQFLLK